MGKPIEGEIVPAKRKHGGTTLFKPGESGNPAGRPKGSKNRITVLKMLAEENFREENHEKLQEVLNQIVDAALEGDRSARKMVWDAMVSKPNISEDKSANQAQQITVHRMTVNQDKPKKEIKNDEQLNEAEGQELD